MPHGMPLPAAAGSELVRMLAQPAHPPIPPSASPMALRDNLSDKLGQWLGWRGALQLSAALSATAAAVATPRAGSRSARSARQPSATDSGLPQTAALADQLSAQWQRQRRNLEQMLSALPAPTPADVQDLSAFRLQFQQLQKGLLDTTSVWRERLRLALQARSPEGTSLAALDAVMEQALADNERTLSSEVLRRAQQRLQQRFAEHPAGTPPSVHEEIVKLLQAELQHRELPLLGLLAALRGDMPETLVR